MATATAEPLDVDYVLRRMEEQRQADLERYNQTVLDAANGVEPDGDLSEILLLAKKEPADFKADVDRIRERRSRA